MATFSPITNEKILTTKRSSRQGSTVERMIIHHWGGVNGGVEHLTNPKVSASANYILRSSGSLIGSVPEEYRAWTSGSFAADRNSVTVEVQNTTASPLWQVSAKSIEKLAQLVASVAKRYGWKKIDSTNVLGHRKFQATLCPGPFLYPRLADVIKRANEIWKGVKPTPPKPNPKPTPKPTPTPPKPSNGYTVKVTANSLNIRSGAGTNYKVVGTIKNKGIYTIVQESGSWGKLKSGAGWIHLGYTTRVSSNITPPKPARKSNETIAREVIKGGIWGNGTVRTNKLKSAGYNPKVIQSLVNKMLK